MFKYCMLTSFSDNGWRLYIPVRKIYFKFVSVWQYLDDDCRMIVGCKKFTWNINLKDNESKVAKIIDNESFLGWYFKNGWSTTKSWMVDIHDNFVWQLLPYVRHSAPRFMHKVNIQKMPAVAIFLAKSITKITKI